MLSFNPLFNPNNPPFYIICIVNNFNRGLIQDQTFIYPAKN
jgi:hypothetical protein